MLSRMFRVSSFMNHNSGTVLDDDVFANARHSYTRNAVPIVVKLWCARQGMSDILVRESQDLRIEQWERGRSLLRGPEVGLTPRCHPFGDWNDGGFVGVREVSKTQFHFDETNWKW